MPPDPLPAAPTGATVLLAAHPLAILRPGHLVLAFALDACFALLAQRLARQPAVAPAEAARGPVQPA